MSSTVSTTTSSGALFWVIQRKSFYASGRFWVFYADGANIVYYTSVDGTVWNVGGSSPVRACVTGYDFSIWFDGTYMHYVHGRASSLHYRRGTPNADGTITWSAVEQTVVTVGNLTFYPFVSIDTNNDVWISYYENSDGRPYVIKSGNNDGTWGATPAGFPYRLVNLVNHTYTEIIPLTSGKMLALYTGTGGLVIKSQQWNGAAWGAEATTTLPITTGGSHGYNAVSEGDNVHLCFLTNITLNIVYSLYDPVGNTWGAEVMVQAAVTVSSSPVLSIDPDTNDLYCFWAGSPAADHIYYKIYTGGAWDAAPTDWLDESADGLKYNIFTGFYQAWDDYIGIVFLTTPSSPYNVKFAYLQIARDNGAEGFMDGFAFFQ